MDLAVNFLRKHVFGYFLMKTSISPSGYQVIDCKQSVTQCAR